VLEIEVIGEGSNANKGVVNPGISKEEEVIEAAMEIQAKFLEVTTSILENIDISIERAKESIPTIRGNTNKEQTKEEMVVIGAKQPKKRKEKSEAI
jgi:hypothetical protein